MVVPILSVQDVDASVDFYVKQLGFERLFVMAGSDGRNAMGWVKMGDAQFGLMLSGDTGSKGNGVDLWINLPKEGSIDQLYTDVQRRGATIAEPIKDHYWGDRAFTVHDPDGYVLTFAQTVKQVPMEQIEAIMRSGSPA
ncbi:MAG: VOC family protein [Anaerolineae bacterium]|nr:VOC family protein [Anaerolineae bacterium]